LSLDTCSKFDAKGSNIDNTGDIDNDFNDADIKTDNDLTDIEALEDADIVGDIDTSDEDAEAPDIDMYCPKPEVAGYPYYDKKMGGIHFCRPCDIPDEYDPQCVKSLWKDINKASYEYYISEGYENNEYVAECYPWPCEWDVEPTPHELSYYGANKCDLIVNPNNWRFYTNDYLSTKGSINNGIIAFSVDNYDMDWVLGVPYSGDRAVVYNIEKQR